MGPFELFTHGRDLPVFAFRLRADITSYSVFDLSDQLRMHGWQVPAYTFPADMTDTAVMRIVVRNGFSMDLANLFLDDLRRQVQVLEYHPLLHQGAAHRADSRVSGAGCGSLT